MAGRPTTRPLTAVAGLALVAAVAATSALPSGAATAAGRDGSAPLPAAFAAAADPAGTTAGSTDGVAAAAVHAVQRAVTGRPDGVLRLVVVASSGAVADAERAARAAGARVVAVQRTVGTLVLDARTGDAVAVARRLLGTGTAVSVTPDSAVRPASLGADAQGQKGSMELVARVVGATPLWRRGITGEGIGVALLDTGVAPVPGLLGADKVVIGPDLSFESQNWRLRNLDTYGHGTHMAGIIAGREGPKATGADYAADTRRFYGIAPDATIVSLKLADRYGAVDVSQVVAALDWVVQHRDDTGVRIRVVNLSFGTPSQQAPWSDPLSYAAEVAVRYGIVVVAAAGNNGANGYGLNDPAYNRNVIAVGSSATGGTEVTDDDKVPWFSARRGGAAWWRAPDVVAPGSGIVSLKVPGSHVADTYPQAAVGALGIRGSGTSQSAAVVSGAVALLLQQRPWLDPAQVKWLLTSTAKGLPGEGEDAEGAGSIDLRQAARTFWVQSAATSTSSGRGSLERARGGVHVSDGAVELTGEQDVMGQPWSPRTAWLTATAQMWTPEGAWNGAAWTGDGFAADDGPDGVWSGRTWAGRTWSGRTWSGRTWSGRTWSDARWAGPEGFTATAWPEPQEGDEFAAKLWGTAEWGTP